MRKERRKTFRPPVLATNRPRLHPRSSVGVLDCQRCTCGSSCSGGGSAVEGGEHRDGEGDDDVRPHRGGGCVGGWVCGWQDCVRGAVGGEKSWPSSLRFVGLRQFISGVVNGISRTLLGWLYDARSGPLPARGRMLRSFTTGGTSSSVSPIPAFTARRSQAGRCS